MMMVMVMVMVVMVMVMVMVMMVMMMVMMMLLLVVVMTTTTMKVTVMAMVMVCLQAGRPERSSLLTARTGGQGSKPAAMAAFHARAASGQLPLQPGTQQLPMMTMILIRPKASTACLAVA